MLGIAGLGCIGGSIALRAAALGWRVVGYDPDPEAADVLRAAGAALETGPSLGALAAACETLVLAGPLAATLDALTELAAVPPAATLIVDVASVKAVVATAGGPLAAFVPTHPMAGSERSGATAARADLFVGHRWAYEPTARGPAVARALDFVRAMGAVPVAVDSADHDRAVALTSHLPQLFAVALGARLEARSREPAMLALCGPGARGMLRLAASSWPLWRPILAANAAALAQEVRACAAILRDIADALDLGAFERVGERFAAAAAFVARLSRENAIRDDVRKWESEGG